jgi:hypothetical protein
MPARTSPRPPVPCPSAGPGGDALPSTRTSDPVDLDLRGLPKRPAIPSPTRSRGCSSMVEPQPSKLAMRVRFPSPAPRPDQLVCLSPSSAGRRRRCSRSSAMSTLFTADHPTWPVPVVCGRARLDEALAGQAARAAAAAGQAQAADERARLPSGSPWHRRPGLPPKPAVPTGRNARPGRREDRVRMETSRDRPSPPPSASASAPIRPSGSGGRWRSGSARNTTPDVTAEARALATDPAGLQRGRHRPSISTG